MDEPKKEPEQPGIDKPTIEQRIKDGRKGILWTIDISYYAGEHSQVMKHRSVVNMYWSECLTFRFDVFEIGFLINEAPGKFRLVAPHNVHEVFFNRQNGYFEGK